MKVEPLNETCLVIPNAISPNGDLINDVWNIGLIDCIRRLKLRFSTGGAKQYGDLKRDIHSHGMEKQWKGSSDRLLPLYNRFAYGSKLIVGNVTIVRINILVSVRKRIVY